MISKILNTMSVVKMMSRTNKAVVLKLSIASLLLLICHDARALDIFLDGSYAILKELSYDCDGGVEGVSVLPTGSATIGAEGRTSATWLSWVRFNNGRYDSGRLTIDRNNSVYGRSGLMRMDSYLVLNGGSIHRDGEILINVQQSGAPVTVMQDGLVDYDVEGGEGTFRIETVSEAMWQIDTEWLYGDESNWVTFSKTNGTGSCEVSYVVKSSTLCRSRSVRIVVASKEFVFVQTGNLGYDGVKGNISGPVVINAAPFSGDELRMYVDGGELLCVTNKTQYIWQPQALGKHTLSVIVGTNSWSDVFNVKAFDYYVTPAPNPPMAKDNNVAITPTTRNFGVNGGGNAILVSGSSSTWTAAVSDPWITLNATSGNVGYPVAYTVSANTNVEQRTGYVYVSGWVHTVTQDGVGGTISPENVVVEHQGGSGAIAVSAANKMVWQARPNVDWLSVSPTSGAGTGSVTYQVAPYNEVATRQGTLTVAGNTFTVFQYGRRMKLDSYNTTQNYETHVIPITVNALAITQWSVTPNNSWISVVDAGNGQGGDLVTIAIGENPSYKARTGTVTIGTETFTVTQQGRPTEALSFAVSPLMGTIVKGQSRAIFPVRFLRSFARQFIVAFPPSRSVFEKSQSCLPLIRNPQPSPRLHRIVRLQGCNL